MNTDVFSTISYVVNTQSVHASTLELEAIVGVGEMQASTLYLERSQAGSFIPSQAPHEAPALLHHRQAYPLAVDDAGIQFGTFHT